MNRGARQDRETRLAAARKCKRLGFVRERQSTWRLPCSPKRVHLIPDTLTKCVQSCADSESCEGFGWRRPTATSNHHCYHFKPEHAQSCGADAFSHDRTVLRYKKVRMCDLQGSGSGSGRRLVERPDSDDELAFLEDGGRCWRDVGQGTFYVGKLQKFSRYTKFAEGAQLSPDNPIEEVYTALAVKLNVDELRTSPAYKYTALRPFPEDHFVGHYQAVGQHAAQPGEYTVVTVKPTSDFGSFTAPFKLGDKIYAPGYNGCAFAIYSIEPESYSSPGGLTQRRFVAVHSYRTTSQDGTPAITRDYSGLNTEFENGKARAHWELDQRKGSIFSILNQPDDERPPAARGWKECVPPFRTGDNIRATGLQPNPGYISEVFVESRLEGGRAVMYVSIRDARFFGLEPDFKPYLRKEC